ncbi:hypothetical protein [Paracoccus laeviglucosivorans]|uniref:Uncharacterized protein n=1 Tax=Paracoccus laeviglucosivorans TaxID=1197861 RepID=A0A521CXI9_9RHOB|nr:hypothetical protein [Paracoccus laeviglucosivorans]SMO64134.1 hypothetical protein SAMN06265221_105262 [Paracoccus laeviglucosivorans]
MTDARSSFIVADPSAIWLINNSTLTADVERTLINGMSLLTHELTGVKVVMDNLSVERLYEQSLVPTEHWIKPLLENHGLQDVFDPRLVASIINNFLISNSGLPIPQEFDCLAQVIFEDSSDEVFDANKDFSSISEVSLTRSVLSSLIYEYEFLYSIPALRHEFQDAIVQISVEMVDPASDGVVDGCEIESEVRFICSPSYFMLDEDPLAIWCNAPNQEGIKDAIRVAWKQSGKDLSELPPFSVGTRFVESLKANAGQSSHLSSTLLKKIVAAINQPEHFSVFRRSAALNSGARIRERDGATALRLHITDRHEGYRLMAWLLKDGEIELANVGPKKEEYIADGH